MTVCGLILGVSLLGIALGIGLMIISDWNWNSRVYRYGQGLLVFAIIVGLFSGAIGTLRTHSVDYEYITPVTITKTADGFTIASYSEGIVSSDKTVFHLEDKTNIFIQISVQRDDWGLKVNGRNGTKKELTIGKPNDIVSIQE